MVKKIFSLKNFLLVLTGGLVGLVLIIATIIAIFDDDDYRQLVIRWVDFSSDYRLEISGPFHFSVSTAPKLSATGIELLAKTGDNNISLQAFELQFMLAPLLDGTLQIDRLLVTDMVVNLTDPSSEDADPGFISGYFLPALILKSAMITNVVVNVAAKNKSYILKQLNIDDANDQGSLLVDASGSINALHANGLDLPALGSIKFQGKFTGNNEQACFDGLFKFNQTEVTSKLTILYMDEPPAVKGSIYIPVLHMQDIGINYSEPQKSDQQIQPKKQDDDHFFSRTPIAFDSLSSVDLDIKIDIDELEGTEYAVDTINMDIKLKKGVLRIDSAKFRYASGQVNAKATIDASKNKPPHLNLNLKGDKINLKGQMQQSKIPSPIEGNINLVLDLSSTGVTAHELAANLNGEVGITLENGMIQRREIDILFLDFVDWLFSFRVGRNEMEITCAIAHYKINKGVLNTEVFYLDGPKINARGRGTIDLDTEKNDIVINLEKKKFLLSSRTPIHIRGTLSDPSVSSISYKEAVLSVGSYIFAPFITIPVESLGAVGVLLYETGSRSTCQERVAKP